MRTNPFYDTWLFLLAQTGDQTALGAWRWPLLGLFAALLFAGAAIAARNATVEPAQRSGAQIATWALRTLIGCMWFQALYWKLPFSTSNGLYYWTQQLGEHAAFEWYRDLVHSLLLPGFAVLNPLVFLTELAFSVSLILGLGVRLMGAVGFLYALNLWIGLYRKPEEWPWNYIFLAALMGLFSLYAAGRSLGLDAMLRRRSRPKNALIRLAT